VPHRAQNILISIHEWLLKNMASSH